MPSLERHLKRHRLPTPTIVTAWRNLVLDAAAATRALDPKPDYGEIVLCEHRGAWFKVDGKEDDGAVYLHGDHEFLGPIPLSNLINLGPTSDRFWTGDKFATGNHWDLIDGAEFPNLRSVARENH